METTKKNTSIMNIVLIAPERANGGITSWANHYKKYAHLINVTIRQIDNTPLFRKSSTGAFSRIWTGGIALLSVIFHLLRALLTQKVDLVHATTSGSIGVVRDLLVGYICRFFHKKCILHCHYGCLVDDLKQQSYNSVLNHSLRLFDQIWVLDSRTYEYLSTQPEYDGRVYLVPNAVEVNIPLDSHAKNYNVVGFCGNLIPSKGIYELVESCTKTDVELHIIGPGTKEVIDHIAQIAGDLMGNKIFCYGRLPNPRAVDFLKKVDIIALPTYYKYEAFPVSILEAMSLSKLVISCPCAAIPDILTATDGSPCGLLVEPKAVAPLVKAIQWCKSHKEEADQLCQKAYKKVYSCYRKEVVYEIYKNNYKQMLSNY